MTWISTENQLPPMYKRVSILVQHSNLIDRNGREVLIYCASREPEYNWGPKWNNERPYCYRAENSASWWGQEVIGWQSLPSENLNGN